MAVVNSSEVYAKISTDGGVSFRAVVANTEANVALAHEPRDVTVKYDLGVRQLAEGKRTWDVDGSGWAAFTADTFSPADMSGLLSGRTVVFVELVAGNEENAQVIVGRAHLTAKSDEGGTEDNQGYSLSLSGIEYFSDTWGGYMQVRAEKRGATVESKGCLDSIIYSLRQVIIN